MLDNKDIKLRGRRDTPKPKRADMLKIRAATLAKKIGFGRGVGFNSLIK